MKYDWVKCVLRSQVKLYNTKKKETKTVQWRRDVHIQYIATEENHGYRNNTTSTQGYSLC